MPINFANTEFLINEKLNNATSDGEILLYSAAIAQLKSGAIFTVSNFSELPAANSVLPGSLYFVERDRTLYIPYQINDIWIPIIVDSAEQVWAWGSNTSSQLGIGTTVNQSSPASVVGGFIDWCQVSAGGCHTAALRSNGTIWTWGAGTCGRLGDGTIINKSSPVSVVGGFTDWCQVSAGDCRTTALRTNGTLWTWGAGTSGELGDGTTVAKSSPVSVVGGFTDWCQVSAGGVHTVALRTNGSLWAWGSNAGGRFGNGATTNRSSPVSGGLGFTDWCQASAGVSHTAAVRTNGTAWAWGCGVDGQLGDDTLVNKSSPVSVVGGFTDWCQVSAGNRHTAALRINGTLWTWGIGTNGELGDGTAISKSSPVSVVGGFTNWCQVSANQYHTAAVRTNGTLWTWGRDRSGQLGDGTAVNRSSPVLVVGGFTDWCQVSAGRTHTTAIRSKTF